MKKERPRVVVVGAGGYGRFYVEELTEHDRGADLVAVCDTDPALVERVPVLRTRGIPVYTSLEEFFSHGGAELAVLASPVHFHRDMVLTCFAHGANVLCEKPLCLTVAQAEEMRAAARRAGRILSVGYQFDYRRDALALKKDILAGRFGKPLRIAVYHGGRRGANYYARNDWAGRITCGGREVFDSPFTNACAHNFQLMTFLLGQEMHTACPVESVQAELYRANPALENYDIAALRFTVADGVPLLYYTAHPIRTASWGPVGVLEFEKAVIRYTGEEPVFHGVMADGTPFDYSAVDPGASMQKLIDAIEAVNTGVPPVCGVEADLPHIAAVRMVQENPIRPVRDALLERAAMDGDRFCFVRGLEEMLADCAAHWALPGELGYSLA